MHPVCMSEAVQKRDFSLESPTITNRHSGGVVASTSKGGPQDGSSGSSGVPKREKMSLMQVLKSRLFLGIVVFCVVSVTLLCIGLVATYEKDSDVTLTIDAWNDKLSAEQLFWFQSGLGELKHALGQSPNTRRAKNVILFVADGMGPATVTAARIYKGQEEGHLLWERFPHMGLLKVGE